MINLNTVGDRTFYSNISLFDNDLQSTAAGAKIIYTFSNHFSEFLPKIDSQVVTNPLEINNFYNINDLEKYYKGYTKINTLYSSKVFINQERLKQWNGKDLSGIPQYVTVYIPKIPNILNDQISKLQYPRLKALLEQNTIRDIITSKELSLQKYFLLSYLDKPYEKQKFDNILEKNYQKILDLNFFKKSSDEYVKLNELSVYEVPNKFTSNLTLLHFNRLFEQIGPRHNNLARNIFQDREKTTTFPLFYVIKKYLKNNSRPFQQIYIPCGEEEIKYIDTQVLPNQEYVYKIDLLCLFFAISKPKDIAAFNRTPITSREYEFYKFFGEINLFSREPELETTFPLIPEPTFFSLTDDPRTIRIFLNKKISYEETKPFDIRDVNKGLSKKAYFSNTFENYILYKTQVKPTSYKSFANNRYRIIKSTENSFFEEVEYNKEYYYMFTTYDGKNYSNPSDIIKVNIQNINGAIVPIIETYVPGLQNEEDDQIKSKSLQKIISISPSTYQLDLRDIGEKDTYMNSENELNFDTSKYLNLSSIYGDPSKINNKIAKFKVRITSKSSGKVVDVNLNFKYRIINNIKNE